ncbi:MAG TPA: acetamidase/formamidase family protein [Stellaceae bacterium]|nr:acetamidase/formamidase family protein [Stellaceae bacterium]
MAHCSKFLRVALFCGAGALALAATGPASAQAPNPPPPEPVKSTLDEALMVSPAPGKPGKVLLLPATMETTQWGWYNNAQPPVLHMHSGDTVVMETMMHSHNQVVPGVSIDKIKKLRTDFPGRGPHTITGPIYVEGAEPGDVLKIHFDKIVPRAYATNFNVPGMFGQFPDRFPDGQVKYFFLDLDKKQLEFAPGIVVPLKPFPGTIGVARAEPGAYSTVPPGPFGGNMDINEMVEGTTLYLPVFVKGALLWSGDSHAGQGNGEINLTAIETAFKELRITVTVLKNVKLAWPRIETSRHWITIGYDKDFNKAWDLLQAETVKYLMESRKLDADAAKKEMIADWDCRISEVVDVLYGTYCMTPKSHGGRAPMALPKTDDAKYLVTYSKSPDLKKAMDEASYAMIEKLQKERNLSRLDAYALASMTMDCRLGRPSGADKEVHCMVPKSLWVANKM